MSETHRLSLTALDARADLPRGLVSLPLPRGGHWTVGIEGCQCQLVPVAVWPRSEPWPGAPRAPRRVLVYITADHPLPAALDAVLTPCPAPAVVSREDAAARLGWQLEVKVVERQQHQRNQSAFPYYREINELALRYGGRELGLRLGALNPWGPHQWQYVQAEPLWSGPLAAGYRVGGHIYVGYDQPLRDKELEYVQSGLRSHPPDETLAASLYLVLFADGTLQAAAHFVNGRVYHGSGPTLGVPVIFARGLADAVPEAGRRWTGADALLRHDGLALDLGPAAHLVSNEHPGKLTRVPLDSALLCWQPVQNTRIELRTRPDGEGGIHEDVVDGSPAGLVQGAARSVPFALSLSAAIPGLRRYLAPPAYYAACEELAPRPLRHRSGPYAEISRLCGKAFLDNTASGRFTAGGIYRYLYQHGRGTYELSMDGNECRSLYRLAYWLADPDLYALAERNAYFCADLAVDHSRDIVHYHGDQTSWKVYSLIYTRFSGLVYGYLETGDRYLLDNAVAVAHSYMNHHRQNWPRRGMGRDLDPLAGFAVLYDYTGDEHWLDFAREVADNQVRVIGAGGEWLSGAGVGPYWGCNAAEGSPWNGGHFFHGFAETLMRLDDVPPHWIEPARRGVRKLLRDLWENNPHRFHPAACGFVGRTHWYIACRLGDEELKALVRQLMDRLLVYKDNPTDEPLFNGGKAHHMNNYMDYLLYYEATRDAPPA